MYDYDEWNAGIGQRIRERRVELGYSREKLAELADMSEKYLGEVERGEKKISARRLAMIAAPLGVTMDYVVFGKNESEEWTAIANLLRRLKKADMKIVENVIRAIYFDRQI